VAHASPPYSRRVPAQNSTLHLPGCQRRAFGCATGGVISRSPSPPGAPGAPAAPPAALRKRGPGAWRPLTASRKRRYNPPEPGIVLEGEEMRTHPVSQRAHCSVGTHSRPLDAGAAVAIADRFLILEVGDLLGAESPQLAADGLWVMAVTLSNA